jgi:hypothetical protein
LLVVALIAVLGYKFYFEKAHQPLAPRLPCKRSILSE